jgi:plasmid maintenance system antidote protein VapI
MTSAIFEPTEIERRTIDELQGRIREFLEQHPERKEELASGLGLSQGNISRLLDRTDWTLAAALRIADRLGLEFDLRVV